MALKYKIGDKVKIKSLDWYNENKNKYGNIICAYMPFTSEMSIYCGAVLTICDINDEVSFYHMKKCEYQFTDEMIECKVGQVEEETQSKELLKDLKENAKHYWKVINGDSKPKFKVGDKVTLDLYPCVVTTVEWKGDSEYVGYVYTVRGTDFGKKVKEADLVFRDVEEETKPEPKFKVGDSVEVLKTGNTYTISQMKFNGKEFVYTLSITDNSACWFSEDELKPIHFINIAIKPHNVRGDEIIKMLEELGGTNAFSFDGSDHNCVNPFAYYIDNDDKQIYGGGIEFLRKNGYKIHALEELKKKEYPKTYEECCEIVKVEKKHTLEGEIIRKNNYKIALLESFQKLLICRDAYWKLYGEEKGLGEPWEPDYDSGVNKYGIICMNGVVQESNPTTNWERHLNKVLDFPTEEMRDAFKENFDPDIEICKELL